MAMLNNQRVITNKRGDSRLNVPISKQNDRVDVDLLLQRLEIVTTGIQFIDHQAPPEAMNSRGSGREMLVISWDFMGFMWIYVD